MFITSSMADKQWDHVVDLSLWPLRPFLAAAEIDADASEDRADTNDARELIARHFGVDRQNSTSTAPRAQLSGTPDPLDNIGR